MSPSPHLARPWVALLVGWAFAFVFFSAWAVASPVSSAPDESGHIMKAAATARGMLQGEPTDSPGNESFRLPADVADVGGPMTCTAFHAETPASCQPDFDSYTSDEVTVVSGVGSYNPLYYAAVGWPSLLLHGDAAVISMRLMSALLNSFFVGVLFWVSTQLGRGRSLLGWAAVAFTPMAGYLSGVVNPNGVEITACAALAATAWLVVHGCGDAHLKTAVAFVAASGIVAANTRTASPLFVAVIVVAVLLTVPFDRVRELARLVPVRVAAAVSVVGLAAAAAWTLLVAAPAGFIPSSDPARDGLLSAAVRTLGSTDEFGTELIGVFGWFDTGLPAPVQYGWTAAIGFVVLGALVFSARRSLPGVLLLMAAFLFVPTVIQAPSASTFGDIWQGRYSLPLFVAMIIVAGLAWGAASPRPLPRRLVPVIVVMAGAGQLASFAAAYRRFSVGIGRPYSDVLAADAWQAPGGLALVVALCGVGVAGLIGLACATDHLSRVRVESAADALAR
jgi:hypothetical protein